jgi:RND family efflux transporter MFP subunit
VSSKNLFSLRTAGIIALAGMLASCGSGEKTSANTASVAPAGVSVGVAPVGRTALGRTITLSSELVPFQEIDVYAKESGFVKQLDVDYGTRVKAGQVMAVLEIPELQLQLEQDDAAIKSAADQVKHAEHELNRVEAQHQVMHLQFERLNRVAKAKPGLVAQQEVDDAQGKDLAGEAQVEGSKSSFEAAQSQLVQAQAKRQHDQVLFDYSKITAPFAGVVTRRFANLGTLVQAGTNSSTQALPLARLSQDDLFRLVIPVPEAYVRYIKVGDPVKVLVPALNQNFPGKVARFAVDVKEDTRTMHTEVDVPNPKRVLIPGMYAEAVITIENKEHALAVPLQAVNRESERTSVYVVTPANKVEARPVKLGIETSTQAEVLSGLEDGELVVVSERSGLKAGQEVRPKTVESVEYSEQDQKK